MIKMLCKPVTIIPQLYNCGRNAIQCGNLRTSLWWRGENCWIHIFWACVEVVAFLACDIEEQYNYIKADQKHEVRTECWNKEHKWLMSIEFIYDSISAYSAPVFWEDQTPLNVTFLSNTTHIVNFKRQFIQQSRQALIHLLNFLKKKDRLFIPMTIAIRKSPQKV